jgi:phosphomannomutase
VYEVDKNVYRDDWELPKDIERFLEDELAYSCFPIRNGNHIERRPGGVNFSILGRDPDPMKGRAEYIKWDKERLEREDIADRLRNQFPELTVALGGQTGIDIGPKGADKSQILRDFRLGQEIHFFGDRMEKGGNDHSLGEAVKEMGGYPHSVNNWEETRTILEGMQH